uniref:DNA-directed RNA polymerase III subunit RPC4 n=1 Tax=Rhabditophanes sp. KR3021 TaxID=114890 RepID=A0AC35U982_9BILA
MFRRNKKSSATEEENTEDKVPESKFSKIKSFFRSKMNKKPQSGLQSSSDDGSPREADKEGAEENGENLETAISNTKSSLVSVKKRKGGGSMLASVNESKKQSKTSSTFRERSLRLLSRIGYSDRGMKKMLNKLSVRDEKRSKSQNSLSSLEGDKQGIDLLDSGDYYLTKDSIKCLRREHDEESEAEYDASSGFDAETMKEVLTQEEQFQQKVIEARKTYPCAYMSLLDKNVELPKRNLVSKNKSNNGFIFNKIGIPFWMNKKKFLAEQDETDDTLPLNANILREVAISRIKLTSKRKKAYNGGVFGNIKKMADLDDKCFEPEVIFSNTIRSMIKLADNENYLNAPLKKSTSAQVTFDKLPTTIVNYNRFCIGEYDEGPYTVKQTG